MIPGLTTHGLSFFSHLQNESNDRMTFISFSSSLSGGWEKREVIEHYAELHICQMCECGKTPEKKTRRMVLALQNSLGNRCGMYWLCKTPQATGVEEAWSKTRGRWALGGFGGEKEVWKERWLRRSRGWTNKLWHYEKECEARTLWMVMIITTVCQSFVYLF